MNLTYDYDRIGSVFVTSIFFKYLCTNIRQSGTLKNTKKINSDKKLKFCFNYYLT